MVKYLNNRRGRKRTNQQSGSQQQQDSGGNDGNAGAQGQNAGDQNQSPNFQDHPALAVLTWAAGAAKSLLTYKPREYDDRFSLGGRRTQNRGDIPNPDAGQAEDTSQAQGQGGESNVQDTGGSQSGARSNKGDKAQAGEKGTVKQAAKGQGQGKGQNEGRQGPGAGGAKAVIPPPPGTGPYFQQQPGSKPGPKGQVRHTKQGGVPPGQKKVQVENQIHFDLDKNLTHVKRVFDIPINRGFSLREFLVGFEPPHHAFVVYTEGMADKNLINNQVLQPLMILSSLNIQSPCDPIALVRERLVSSNQVEEKWDFTEIIEGVLAGSTALFIEGSNSALLIETKGWEHRGIGRPQVENVVRGPQEGFNELLVSNMALVRSRLRTENLVSEMFKIGTLSKADVAVMYLRDIANPAVVQEVRKRLGSLQQVDYVPDTGILEQFIEDSPFSLTPQMLSTERPDRVAGYLAEGHVALLMSSTPFALIVPATFWALLHAAEDSYVRWPYGGLMRMVRASAVLVGMFLPAVYIAVINFHQSMLPPDLLFAIAAYRERIPFPSIVALLLMEGAFELIREAGIRIPSIIGTTIGIVGALILGQAVVQANLISPIVIIITAVTGLSSFAIPNYNLAFNVRIIRFIYVGLASMAGFYAIALGMFVQMTILNSSYSFGVPVLSPAAPNRPSKDTVFRAPMWAQEKLPNFVRPLKPRRQAPISRSWSPSAYEKRGERKP